MRVEHGNPARGRTDRQGSRSAARRTIPPAAGATPGDAGRPGIDRSPSIALGFSSPRAPTADAGAFARCPQCDETARNPSAIKRHLLGINGVGLPVVTGQNRSLGLRAPGFAGETGRFALEMAGRTWDAGSTWPDPLAKHLPSHPSAKARDFQGFQGVPRDGRNLMSSASRA